MSASSSTIRALFPPSSSETFFRCRPPSSPTRRPTAVDPVNEMSPMRGSTTIASPASAAPGRACRTPSGSPASSKIDASRRPPVIGVCASGLMTTALPSASAGAITRMPRITGAFHGVIAPTTPIGTRWAKLMRPRSVVGSSSPNGCPASAEASRISPTLMRVSWVARARISPVSRTSQSITDGARSSSSAAARRRIAARSSNDVAAHAGCAAAARSAASATSVASARPTVARSSPVAFSRTSTVPPCAARQPPLCSWPSHCVVGSSPSSCVSLLGNLPVDRSPCEQRLDEPLFDVVGDDLRPHLDGHLAGVAQAAAHVAVDVVAADHRQQQGLVGRAVLARAAARGCPRSRPGRPAPPRAPAARRGPGGPAARRRAGDRPRRPRSRPACRARPG